MAVVYQVLDKTNKREVALKKLVHRERAEKQQNVEELFEHEFHILSQLSHPRVIEVYDYGVDGSVPYYTMELLDGGDLREISPLPWKKACSLLRDVCSALSLLHSRRKIHRDLTPRNVRCTRDGKAKLIDFGAMVPMGHCKYVIGTPPFTAPEVVNILALDARTDLYSLGATAFYVLTRHHAYPARNFQELRDLWRRTPKPPSSYVPEIPKELDVLVMSLINLDNMARPVNAAEVMERLSVIASLESDDQLLASKAYLSTPTLVGRDKALAKIRKLIVKACRARGGTVVIEGASGIGRTRMIDACVLEGKLAGTTVLRADAGDKHIGNWGVARSLVSQLVDGLPKLALSTVIPYISVLGHVMPELLGQFEAYRQRKSFPPQEGPWARMPSTRPFRVDLKKTDSIYNTVVDQIGNASDNKNISSLIRKELSSDPLDVVNSEQQTDVSKGHVPEASSTWAEVWGKTNSLQPPPYPEPKDLILEKIDNPQELRPRVQSALRDWFLQISNERVLMVAVDDVHEIDEPSAAFIALLSNHISRNKLVIATTLRSGAPTVSDGVINLLRKTATTIALDNLDLANTEKLLGSVFGETPHLPVIANRLYTVSKGNSLAIMQLAQHLIDKGLVFFQSGAWYLPSRIDSSDLPDSLSEALTARVKAMSAPARQLAQTLALSPDYGFSFEDCLLLSETREINDLIRILDELISAEILTTDRQRYSFSQQGWVPALVNLLSDDLKHTLHLRLSEVFEKNDANGHVIAEQLLGAGEVERALDVLVNRGETTRELVAKNPATYAETILSLPRDWCDTTETAIKACEQLGRPRRHKCVIQFGLVALGVVAGKVNVDHLIQIAEQLHRDSGLRDYQQLDDALDSSIRLTQALQLAQQRYDNAPEAERYLAPADAIRELAQLLVVAISVVAVSFDYNLLSTLPSLKPYIALSPALDVIDKNVENTAFLLTARYDKARQGYRALLARITQSDHCGLDEVAYRYTHLGAMYALGAIESAMGIKSGLDWAAQIEQDPLYQVNAWRVRMTNHMVQGDREKAEQCKKQMELLQIQNSPSQFFESSQIYLELLAYARMDDLIGIKQLITDVRRMADKYHSWNPIYRYAQSEYQRVRGDYLSALSEFEKTLDTIQAGHHIVWPFVSFGYLRTMVGLERYQEAKHTGYKLVAEGEEVGLGYTISYLKMPLALAEARLGDTENAARTADWIVDTFEQLGLTGLNLGLAYETRARIAIISNDQNNFKTYARLCAEQYRAGHNQALTVKYETLMQDACQADLTVSTELEHAADVLSRHEETVYSMVASMMTHCNNRDQRMRTTLDMLTRSSNSLGGFLYTVQQNLPILSANNCKYKPSHKIEGLVRSYLISEVESESDHTIAGDETAFSSNADFEWKNEEGAVFHPLLLGHSAEAGYAVTGVAVLLINPDRLFKFPGDEVVALSRSLADSGDIDPIITSI